MKHGSTFRKERVDSLWIKDGRRQGKKTSPIFILSFLLDLFSFISFPAWFFDSVLIMLFIFMIVYNLQNTFTLISFHFIVKTTPGYRGNSSVCIHSSEDLKESGVNDHPGCLAKWGIRARFAPTWARPALMSGILMNILAQLNFRASLRTFPRSRGQLWWSCVGQLAHLGRALKT